MGDIGIGFILFLLVGMSLFLGYGYANKDFNAIIKNNEALNGKIIRQDSIIQSQNLIIRKLTEK